MKAGFVAVAAFLASAEGRSLAADGDAAAQVARAAGLLSVPMPGLQERDTTAHDVLIQPSDATVKVGRAAQNVPGVLHLPIQRQNVLPRLVRRAGSDTVTLVNNVSLGGYLATVSIGTPGQKLTLHVDTGSSDTWAPASDSQICSDGACNLGSFDKSKSSTFKSTNDDFSISYGDTTAASGRYFTDVLELGDQSLANLTMGLGTSTNNSYGLIGVGFVAGESVRPSDYYPNLPIRLVDAGIISSAAYSLWLNDLDASSGSLLLGGVDTEKYQGNLTRLKLFPDPMDGTTTNITRFLVALTSVTASSSSGSDKLGSSQFPLLVLLDSGTTISYLPADLLYQIYQVVGVETSGYYAGGLPCDAAKAQGILTFGFGGPGGASIKVDMSELVLPINDDRRFPSGPNKGKKVCIFGMQPSNLPLYIFGDTFLRSAYVVYDLVNKEVAMGQTVFNATKTKVVSFASAGAAIPNSAPAPSQDALQSGLVTTPLNSFTARGNFLNSAAPATKAGRTQARRALAILGAVVLLVA